MSTSVFTNISCVCLYLRLRSCACDCACAVALLRCCACACALALALALVLVLASLVKTRLYCAPISNFFCVNLARAQPGENTARVYSVLKLVSNLRMYRNTFSIDNCNSQK